MLINVISWLATAGSLCGQYLINKQNKMAFPIWIVANVLWILVNILSTFNLANVVMYIIYTLLNIHGWISWCKQSDNK